MVGIKREGREGREKRAKGKKEGSAVSSLSPQSPFLFPFLPIPYPFRHLLRRPQHTPSQELSPTLEEWSRFFPKQVHHINFPLQVPHTERKKTEVKQHLIRDKFLSNPIKQKNNWSLKLVSFMTSQCIAWISAVSSSDKLPKQTSEMTGCIVKAVQWAVKRGTKCREKSLFIRRYITFCSFPEL